MDAAEFSAETRTTSTRTTRTRRGMALFHQRHAEIVSLGSWRYQVPSCSGEETYLVNAESGRCTCPDNPPAGSICKHAAAALIFKSKSAECVDCKNRELRREMFEVVEDHDNLTWYVGDVLCRTCAGMAGIR